MKLRLFLEKKDTFLKKKKIVKKLCVCVCVHVKGKGRNILPTDRNYMKVGKHRPFSHSVPCAEQSSNKHLLSQNEKLEEQQSKQVNSN